MSAAHAAVLAADALSAHIDPDGYSWPYVLAAALTSSLAGLAAVLLCRQIALRYAGDFAATTATMAIWLATPFIFFQTVQPLMSHTTDAAANALCILLWLRARQHPDSGSTAFALGAATGAAVWVRAQNGILPAVFALDALLDLLACLWQSSGARALQVARSRLAPLGAGFALLAAPLLLFWRTVYGAWVLNTYTATGGGSFDWSAPHLFDALFSSDRGLFTWAPVTLPAVIGLAVLWRSERRLAIMLGLIGAAHAFVIGSWSAWSGGGTPGPRLWLGILPLFVLGLAALIERARTPRAVTAGAAMALAGWNILLIAQYMLGMVAPEGPVNLAEMAVNQIAVAQRLAGVFLRR